MTEPEDKEIFTIYYRCPKCFVNWSEESLVICEKIDKLCNFCVKNPSSFQLVQRHLEILDKMQPRDFPCILRHMANHIKWKKDSVWMRLRKWFIKNK